MGGAYCGSLGDSCPGTTTCFGTPTCGTGGNCYTDCSGCSTGPSHQECVGSSCISVMGAGVNTCGGNADCNPSDGYHLTCQSSSCVRVSGEGVNTCAGNPDCGEGSTTCPCRVSGYVFVDYNNDGFKNGTGTYTDVNYVGATITLTLPDGSTRTTTSSGTGTYAFSSLTTGSYTLTLTVPATYQASTQNPVLKTLPPTTNVNFGITPSYTVSGNIFVDVNKNRIKDASEANYSGSSTIQVAKGTTCSSPWVAQVTTHDGAYTAPQTVPTGSHAVCYSGPPTGYRMSYPLSGVPPFFTVSLGSTCSPGAHNTASCDLFGNLEDLNFGITNSNPWIQGLGGDMRLDDGFINPLPNNNYASLRGSGGTPGVVFSGDSSSDFGLGQASANPYNWVAGGLANPEVFTPVNSGIIRTAYDYIKTTGRQSSLVATNLGTVCNLTDCDLPLGFSNGFYTTDDNNPETPDDLYLETYTFPADKDYVILVHGNLYLEGEIHVSTTSTVTFSVSGDIIVDKDIGESTFSSTQPNIEGFYSTDGSFIIESYGTEAAVCNADGTPFDKRLNMEGSIVVNAALSSGSFQNQRDLCSEDQNYPTFYIGERLDFFLNAPELIKHPNFTWKEVAP